MALIECKECKGQVSELAKSCPKCGAPVIASKQGFVMVKPQKSKGVATILALLLGGLGIHKFYLDKQFQGLLYLVFCWTFIPAIIALIEALDLMFMSQTTFEDRFC